MALVTRCIFRPGGAPYKSCDDKRKPEKYAIIFCTGKLVFDPRLLTKLSDKLSNKPTALLPNTIPPTAVQGLTLLRVNMMKFAMHWLQ